METPTRNLSGAFRVESASLFSSNPQKRAKDNLDAIVLAKNLFPHISPTKEQEQILARFSGWGCLKNIFEEPKPGWEELVARIKAELSEDEYHAARASILNSHYTDPSVIEAVWKGVEYLGFKGGKVLDNSMGTGLWIGCQPLELRQKSSWTGIEIDPIPAKISQLLYPEATIYQQGFQDVEFPDGSFSLVIGNVPFGSYQVADPRYDKLKLLIHNYFIAKSVDLTRPGGLIVLLTSTGTLTNSERFLERLNDKVRFVGAMRLPNDAFKKSAGTSVTTDLIILQRMHEADGPFDNDWLGKAESGLLSEESNEPLLINQYYVNHPWMVLGKPVEDKIWRGRLAVESDGRDLPTSIAAAFQTLPEGIYEDGEERDFQVIPPWLQSLRPYDFYEDEKGDLYQRIDSVLTPVLEHCDRIKGMLRLAKATRDLIKVQSETDDDLELVPHQSLLSTLYDDFVNRFGAINSPVNRRILREAQDYCLVMTLENRDDKKWVKSEIFYKRTINAGLKPSRFENVEDALIHSIQGNGKLDLLYIHTILDRTPTPSLEAIGIEMHQKGLIHFDPTSTVLDHPDTYFLGWTLTEDFLSGDVRRRMERIENVLNTPELQALLPSEVVATLPQSLAELKKVCPKWLLPACDPVQRSQVAERLGIMDCQPDGSIFVKLGSAWIPPEYIQEFAAHLIGVPGKAIRVTYAETIAAWGVNAAKGYESDVLKSEANQVTYGVEGHKTALGLLEQALNQSDPVVYVFKLDGTMVKDPESTEVARSKVTKIQEEFRKWAWQDLDRAETLTRHYNQVFNSTVPRVFANGNYLNFPGMNPEITLREHQKRGVWRVLQRKATLFSWEVGTGKTIGMCASIMRARQLGLVSKPVLVVLKSTLSDIIKEFRRLYPQAELLVPMEKDFQRENRRRLHAMISTRDFDCCILTHEQFFSLSMSQSAQKNFYREQIHIVQDLIEEIEAENEGRRNRLTKQLESFKRSLETKLYRIIDSERKDYVINFEDTGIDMIAYDESQFSKNLYYHSRQYGIAGLSMANSQRAMDMFMKVSWLLEREKSRVIFSTGTDLSNSIAELFTLMRFLIPHRLKALKIEHFDGWSASFAEATTTAEISATCRYKVKTRFSRFANLPELIALYLEFADLQSAEGIPGMDRPNPHYVTVAAPCSPEQADFMAQLVERAERIEEGKVQPWEDNFLAITTDGRKASLHMWLVDGSADNFFECKVNQMVHNIFRIWQETADQKLTQVVFCDFSSPKNNGSFTIPEYCRDLLVLMGVPEHEIGLINFYPRVTDREQLFKEVNQGRVRIVFGATKTLGTGVNIQQRAIAAHEIDCPWTPTSVTQRRGRVHRPKNKNSEVWIFSYVTSGTNEYFGFDSFCWQLLETKAAFIEQLKNAYHLGLREVEDIGMMVLNFNQVKAIATGDQRILEKANIDARILQLRHLKRAHEQSLMSYQHRLKSLETQLKYQPSLVDSMRYDLDRIEGKNFKGDAFAMTIHGVEFQKRKEAGFAILGEVALMQRDDDKRRTIGSYAGFDIVISRIGSNFDLMLVGRRAYVGAFSNDPVGTVMSLQNLVTGGIQILYDREAARLQELQADYDFALKLAGAAPPFEFEDELQLMLARQEELNLAIARGDRGARLVEELDSDSEESTEAEPNTETAQAGDDPNATEPYAPEDDVEVIVAPPVEPNLVEYLLNRPDPEWIAEIRAYAQKLVID